MDAIEAIISRRSIRAFKPEPVPKEVLEKIMESALRAPSWENTQPWEYIVMGPDSVNSFRSAVIEKIKSGAKPALEIPWPKFSGPYKERERNLGKSILPWVGIEKGDKEALQKWWFSMTRLFDAPNAIILYMDKSLGDWSILDIGLSLQNLMVAAWSFGVGTCAMSAAVAYPDVIRDLFGIPESKKIIIGLAVGYPDLSEPAATFRSERDSMDRLVTWHGFE